VAAEGEIAVAASPPDLAERAARNEDLRRKINEQIEPTNAAHTWFEPPMPDWLCECASEDCAKPVQMTVTEYETVRADSTHFLVAPSTEHVVPGLERVVQRFERYWVIEKLGEARELAERLDERSDA
jgi:hypothetical protein